MHYIELLSVGAMLVAGYFALRRDIQEVKPKKRVSKKKPEENREEMVYVLANPSYRPGVFKIGLTTRDITVRMRELFTTGVPTPFVKCMALRTLASNTLEASLHYHFRAKRINGKREFFELTQEDIDSIANVTGVVHYEVVSHDVEAVGRALRGS